MFAYSTKIKQRVLYIFYNKIFRSLLVDQITLQIIGVVKNK